MFVVAAVAALLVTGGCGDSDDDGQVTVETGSLSKAQFIKRADSICTAARSQFTQEYLTFLRRKASKSSNSDQDALQVELVETVVIPNFTKDVDQISDLGAPSGDEQEVVSFLDSLQRRLDELREDPSEFSNEVFAKPAKLAQAYGLTRCAQSLN